MSSAEQQLLADVKETFPGFTCTLNDLRNPTEDFVTNFYLFWLQEFEVDINNVNQIQFAQATIVNAYQDAYSGITAKLNLLKAIRAFEVVPDFGMLDLVSPTPRRIQVVIRAFVNFYQHADNHLCLMREKKAKLNERKGAIEKISKEKEDLREKRNTVIKELGQIKDEIMKLEEEAVALQQQSSTLKLEKQVLKTETDKSSDMFKEKENAVQKLDKEDAQITREIKELSNQVVDSPSSELADLESLRTKENEMSELSCQKRDMVESKMKLHKKMQQVVEDQQQRLQVVSEFLLLTDQQRELQEAVSRIEKDTTAFQEELKKLKSLLLLQCNKRKSDQQNLQSLCLRWATLKPQLIESVKSALSELNEKKNEKNRINNKLKEDAAVQERIDSLLKNITNFGHNFQESYENLKKQEKESHDKIDRDLESHMEKIINAAKNKFEDLKQMKI